MEGFSNTITHVDLRLSLAQDALTRMGKVASYVKASLVQSSTMTGTTAYKGTQELALTGLDEMVQLLNTRAGDRYLFGGRAVDTKPVENANTILEGNGTQAGLRQLIAERKAADLGVCDRGRLLMPAPVGTVVRVSEMWPVHRSASSSRALQQRSRERRLIGPAGTPAGLTVALCATNPNRARR